MHRCTGRFGRCKRQRCRRYRPSLRTLASQTCADEHHTVQNDGCPVDGRLAFADAGHGGRWARDHARAERLRDYGSALGDRVHASAADHLPGRWLQGGRDQAPAPAPRTQRGPLFRTARLVLRTDADRDRPGRRDRIHHADLDGTAGRNIPVRTHDRLEDRRDRARYRRRGHDRAARHRRDQSGPADRAGSRDRLQHLHDIGEITDPDRERIVYPILDDRRADGRGSAPDALCLDLAVGPPVGLVVRYRGLRHILALLPRQRAPVRGCDHRGADGLSAGSAHGHRRLAALFRAARLLDRARRGADPLRQSPELEAGFAGSRPRTLNLAPPRATKPSGRVIWITLEGYSIVHILPHSSGLNATNCRFGGAKSGASCKFGANLLLPAIRFSWGFQMRTLTLLASLMCMALSVNAAKA